MVSFFSQGDGLAIAAALEDPQRWGGLVDLPEILDRRVAQRLTVVLADGAEDRVRELLIMR